MKLYIDPINILYLHVISEDILKFRSNSYIGMYIPFQNFNKYGLSLVLFNTYLIQGTCRDSVDEVNTEMSFQQ